MNNLFFKKEEKSVKELLVIFKKNKKPVDCKYIHDHNCFIYAFFHAFKGALQFKKIYLIFFLIKIVKNFRKYNTLRKFFINYFRFFVNPLSYVFVFNFIGKFSFCTMKKNRFLINSYFSLFFSFLAGSSICFETSKRARDLSAYIFGPTFTTIVHHVIKKISKKKNRMNRKFNSYLYCITFGLLIQVLINENDLLEKSILRYFRRLFPSIIN